MHKDLIAGSIDLTAPFSADLTECRETWRGAHKHEADGILCVLWSAPRVDSAASGVAMGHNPAAAIIELWHRHGSALTRHLTGGFAFALVDSKAATVFLAVDRFARQTLCYR